MISQRTVQNNSVSFHGFDGHGSVRYLTDANGSVTDTYDFDAFGNLAGNDPVDRVDPSGNFFDSGSFSVGTAITQTLQSIFVLMFARVVAGVALIAGAVVSPLAELNAGLAQARIGLKERVKRERKRGGNLDLLYHYTSRENAMLIAGNRGNSGVVRFQITSSRYNVSSGSLRDGHTTLDAGIHSIRAISFVLWRE